MRFLKKELENRKSFTFTKYYYNIVKDISDKDAGKLIKGICDYQFNGVEPKFTGVNNVIWIGLKSYAEHQINGYLNGKGRKKSGLNEKKTKNIRKTFEYSKWRQDVFLIRDNDTCQNCGDMESVLDVHHIIPISSNPDLALDPDNGVSLCKPCHKRHHINTEDNE